MEANGTVVDRYKPRGATRLVRALGASWRGLIGAFREEAAFRQELAFAVLVIPLGLWLGHTGVERALLTCPVLLILGTEDGTVSPAQFADMTQAIPGAHTWLLDGGGHVIHRRHAVAFNQRVRAFFALPQPVSRSVS